MEENRGKAWIRQGERVGVLLAVVVASGCATSGNRDDDRGPLTRNSYAAELEAEKVAEAQLEQVKAKRASWDEPADLEDALRRLKEARARLAETGEVPLRYSEEELRALIKAMPIPKERFLVRLVGRPVKDDELLGFRKDLGTTVWMTTFEQLEAADTDPEVLCRLLGLNYDPSLSYTLLVLHDLGKDETQRPEMYVPTRERMLELAVRHLTNPFFTQADYEEVLSPGYQDTYRALMDQFYSRKLREWIIDDVDKFVRETEPLKSNKLEEKRFRTRVRLQVQLGVTEDFRGDGLTALEGVPGRTVGVQEIFVLDRNPKPISEYAGKGQLATVPCAPLQKAGPVTFRTMGSIRR